MDKPVFKKLLAEIQTLGGHPRFYEILLEIAEIHARKNHDYASDQSPLSNLVMCEQFGVPAHIGVLVRITDKFSRLCQVIKKGALISTETIVDTLTDLAVYAILMRILYEEHLTKQELDK